MQDLVSPIDPSTRERVDPAPRPPTLDGASVALLDIGKPRSEQFLDRLEALLRERHRIAGAVRLRKPSHARPAPDEVIEEAGRCAAVIAALAY